MSGGQPPRVTPPKDPETGRIDPVELSRYLAEVEKRLRIIEAWIAAHVP